MEGAKSFRVDQEYLGLPLHVGTNLPKTAAAATEALMLPRKEPVEVALLKD